MITSTSNGQIKKIQQLLKKSKIRREEGLFVAEGIKMFREAPADRIEKIYLSESYAAKNKSGCESLDNTAPVEILSDPAFAHVSGTKTPQGILAVVKRKTYNMSDILGNDPEHTHVLILDNLQDPGNMGTIFRTAEAAGVTGIILSHDCVDIYNPKVVRSTMGAVLRMPFLYVDDLPGTIGELKTAGIKVYAAHLRGKRAYDQEDYKTGCAFLIGNEGNGLRDEVAECADHFVLIPMQGKAESLNAAVAAAVLMFEAARQRRK